MAFSPIEKRLSREFWRDLLPLLELKEENILDNAGIEINSDHPEHAVVTLSVLADADAVLGLLYDHMRGQ